MKIQRRVKKVKKIAFDAFIAKILNFDTKIETELWKVCFMTFKDYERNLKIITKKICRHAPHLR